MTQTEIEAEKKKVFAMSDVQLEDFICDSVRGAAILNSRGRSFNSYDQKCDIGYDESKRRGKIDLYQNGYDRALHSFGFA